MASTNKVRVRFAPSPTGYLHIGGLRTALYNYLYARHHGGTVVLRIEDTDQSRYVAEAEGDITRSLKWAGVTYDEGPDVGGEYGPYRQSERSEHYRKYAEQLIEQGNAYYAFDTTEQIEEMRERLKKSGNPSPKYDSITRMSMTNSLTLPQDEVRARLDAGEAHVVRLKVPRREEIRFEDEIRGFVKFESRGLDDQVLLKSDGLPTYHLANVVDDHLMEISHVIRGEEWLSSAPKHALLYQYLGWEMPKMAHLPLIMSPKGGKLSKRKADELGIPVNVKDYVSGQYEPAAVINFLAFLGWSPGDNRELFTIDELTESFSLPRVSKSGAIFDFKKLMWYNEHYLRARSTDDLLPEVKAQVEDAGYTGFDDAYISSVIDLMRDRAQKISEFVEQGIYFFKAPESYDEKTLKKAWKEGVSALVTEFTEAAAGVEDFNAVNVKEAFSGVLNKHEIGFGKLGRPVRLAVTGIGFGPDLFETMALLGKDETLARLKKAVEVL